MYALHHTEHTSAQPRGPHPPWLMHVQGFHRRQARASNQVIEVRYKGRRLQKNPAVAASTTPPNGHRGGRKHTAGHGGPTTAAADLQPPQPCKVYPEFPPGLEHLCRPCRSSSCSASANMAAHDADVAYGTKIKTPRSPVAPPRHPSHSLRRSFTQPPACRHIAIDLGSLVEFPSLRDA